jgi:ATPase subunit of ABC transporter with duplicated ATPase domains
MITTTNLSMRYGGKILFKNASLQLNPGAHYGLVGANGSGKSTLIKILLGTSTPESGDVLISKQSKMGSLSQDHFLYDEESILMTVVIGKKRLWDALQKKINLLQNADFDESSCISLDEVEHEILQMDGYSAESQAAKLLEGLGLETELHQQPLKILSGGYKLRVLLAQVLFGNPDILILDEPTNHLDLFSIRWLEGYLKEFTGTLLISSHDRNFLNAVCDHIVDIDHGTVKVYKGTYDQFLETKIFNLEQTKALLAKQDKKKEHLQEFIDRFRAKASKARQAQSKIRFAEKLEEEMKELNVQPSTRCYPRIHFQQCRPSGAVVLKVKNISKSFGSKKVLNNLSFEVQRGEKIAFLGANGIGKSTLLEILTGSLAPCDGTISWGHASYYAYFPQDHARYLNGSYSLLTWLGQFDQQISEQDLRDILGKVLFSGDDVHKLINVLSGGEAARLLLAKMMLIKQNILIFDEPTNHLDMEAVEVLIDSLQEYEGTVLFVSHNRHFVSQIADRVIELSHQGMQDFHCRFEEYLEKRDMDLLSGLGKSKEVSKDKSSAINAYEGQKQEQRLNAQRERKTKQAEERCLNLEKQICAINDLLASEGFYQKTPKAEVTRLLNEKKLLEDTFEKAFLEWT